MASFPYFHSSFLSTAQADRVSLWKTYELAITIWKHMYTHTIELKGWLSLLAPSCEIQRSKNGRNLSLGFVWVIHSRSEMPSIFPSIFDSGGRRTWDYRRIPLVSYFGKVCTVIFCVPAFSGRVPPSFEIQGLSIPTTPPRSNAMCFGAHQCRERSFGPFLITH